MANSAPSPDEANSDMAKDAPSLERTATPPTAKAGASGSAPKHCADAIQQGLAEFQKEDFNEAIESFTLALELPGKGSVRMSDSPKEYACPSEGEERAALYNMACCYSRLEEPDAGITVLRGLLETGYDEQDALRTDDDLAFLREQPEFDALLDSFEGGGGSGGAAGIAQALFGGGASKRRKQQKGWLDRW